MPSKNKSRSNTPGSSSSNAKPKNQNNNTNNYVTPTPKSRSQTPNHKHSSQQQTPTPTPTTNNNLNNLSPRTKIAFQHTLEDIHSRFILNLPQKELESSDRIFFQIEQAWWYYEDFICDEMDKQEEKKEAANKLSYANILTKEEEEEEEKVIEYPRYPNLKPFAKKIFEISPILSPALPSFNSLWKEFTMYRRKISTYGTIMLNSNCTKIVLCQDYNSKSWTLPAGKVNQNEKGIDAAARETYEETGFDIDMNFGLSGQQYYRKRTNGNDNANEEMDDTINTNKKKKCTWNELSEEHSVVYIENDGNGKRRTCFICHGVPEDFDFAPVVRKEVADVQWHGKSRDKERIDKVAILFPLLSNCIVLISIFQLLISHVFYRY